MPKDLSPEVGRANEPLSYGFTKVSLLLLDVSGVGRRGDRYL